MYEQLNFTKVTCEKTLSGKISFQKSRTVYNLTTFTKIAKLCTDTGSAQELKLMGEWQISPLKASRKSQHPGQKHDNKQETDPATMISSASIQIFCNPPQQSKCNLAQLGFTTQQRRYNGSQADMYKIYKAHSYKTHIFNTFEQHLNSSSMKSSHQNMIKQHFFKYPISPCTTETEVLVALP